MPDLSRLLTALGEAGVEPTARETVEALWLAARIAEAGGESGHDREPTAHQPAAPAPPVHSHGQREHTPLPRDSRSSPATLYAPGFPGAPGLVTSAAAVPVTVPAVAALTGELRILRSLRPLKRRVPSRHHVVVDEIGTAERSAEERVFLPLTRPEPERWLSLALIVEATSSMAVWAALVPELQRLLQRSGAFRDIRLWYLHLGPSGTAGLHPRAIPSARPHSPREILDPTGRQAVWLVSDCVSEHWRDGQASNLLDLWGRGGPLAIVQPLPQRLWRRTGLQPQAVTLHSSTPGSPNSRLRVTPTGSLAELRSETRQPSGNAPAARRHVPVPVLELEASWLAPWARLVAGMAPGGVPTIVTSGVAPPKPGFPVKNTACDTAPEPQDALSLVRDFRANASPEAYRLAGCLAGAAPLTLPVMRLVQHVMLPDSRAAHLAEVVVSGLLRTTTADAGRTPEYDFLPGIRDVLLTTIRRSDTRRVYAEVSAYLAANVGGVRATSALAVLASGKGDTRVPAASRPFADAPAQVRTAAERHAESKWQVSRAGPFVISTEVGGHPVSVLTKPPLATSPLPSPSPGFTGRSGAFGRLLDALAPDSGVRTVLLHGAAGVGKTELALQVSSRLLTRGSFPGGVLYASLRGYGPEHPLSAHQVLEDWLRRFGVAPDQIPGDEQERAALYHVLAKAYGDRGLRVLVLLDNASDEAQLAPLVSVPGVVALVTSRTRLPVDGMAVELGPLDDTESLELLRTGLARNDTRLSDERQAALRIVRLCAGNPLALRIVAGRLKNRLSESLEVLATTLDRTDDAIHTPSDVPAPVRSIFAWSYMGLSNEEAQLFRLLPVNPGPDISTEAAAQLREGTESLTYALLTSLAERHLISQRQRSSRWRMHDLLRTYAEELSTQEDPPVRRTAAERRLFDYYADRARSADWLLRRVAPPPDTVEPFVDREAAVRWLESERANLVAVVTAAGYGETAEVGLSFALARYLDEHRYYDDWLMVASSAVAALRTHGDLSSREYGSALNNLALALSRTHRVDEAADTYEAAVLLFRPAGASEELATTLNNLGNVLREQGHFENAIIAHQEAAEGFRGFGDRMGEAQALNNLGLAYDKVGRYDEATRVYEQALNIFRDIGDRSSEAGALNNLGSVLYLMGHLEGAARAQSMAADIYQELGDSYGRGRALNNLGIVLQLTGQLNEAVHAGQQAVEAFALVGDHSSQAQALNNLGNALHQAGRLDEALDVGSRAVELFRETGERLGEAQALGNMGLVLSLGGRTDEALGAYRRTQQIFAEQGDQRGEAQALNNLGNALREAGRYDEAIATAERALGFFREVADIAGQGTTLGNLGVALEAAGRYHEAFDAHLAAAAALRAVSPLPPEDPAAPTV